MADIVIRADSVSKHYRLGQIGAGSFKAEMRKWLHNLSGKTNQDESDGSSIWALRDVSFEIRQGERLGIIGSNGAGKSTLLKIISKVTLPTSGYIQGNGRVAALLEVGTGFNYELTGRENLYLNGQILGMRKHEIDSKFDEIVAFSGVEKFLNTPVKRYSSGMFVRLAFSIAAHVNSDILIVDELLSVGDSDFQKKCLEKMREISAREGVTVIFVSHNLNVLKKLCENVLHLDQGRLVNQGPPEILIENYLNRNGLSATQVSENNLDHSVSMNQYIRVRSISLIPDLKKDQVKIDRNTSLRLTFDFTVLSNGIGTLSVNIALFTLNDYCVFDVMSGSYDLSDGDVHGECSIPEHFLNAGTYYFSLFFIRDGSELLYKYDNCVVFEVVDEYSYGEWRGDWWSFVKPKLQISLTRKAAQKMAP